MLNLGFCILFLASTDEILYDFQVYLLQIQTIIPHIIPIIPCNKSSGPESSQPREIYRPLHKARMQAHVNHKLWACVTLNFTKYIDCITSGQEKHMF